MSQSKPSGIVDKIWNLFASVGLAVFTFAALGLTSIVGTIIEQQADRAKNIELLTKLFSAELAPRLYDIFYAMGFMDMYHSWWFLSLLVLFSTNLIVCSIDRLPRIWKRMHDPMQLRSEESLARAAHSRELRLKVSAATARDGVEALLRKSGMNPSVMEDAGGFQVHGQKGKYTRLGVYVVHLSILVIFLGAIYGGMVGFKGFINLPEGDRSEVVYSRGGIPIDLGFTIACDWYETTFYGQSDMPKSYRSQLVVFDAGREVMRKWIRVNDPLRYKGVTFYQSSYGMMPRGQGQELFIFEGGPEGGPYQELRVRRGESFTVPGTDLRATVVDFSTALASDRTTGRLFTYTNTINNPAVKVEFSREGQEAFSTGWIWARHPSTGKLPWASAELRFIHPWGRQYTGLQVRKDPGVWLVYLGCTVMTLGLVVAFFMSHRKLWVLIREDKGGSRVLIAGQASKNRLSFEKDIERISAQLSESLRGGS